MKTDQNKQRTIKNNGCLGVKELEKVIYNADTDANPFYDKEALKTIAQAIVSYLGKKGRE